MSFQDEKVLTFEEYIKYILKKYEKKAEDLLSIGYGIQLAEKMQEIDNQLNRGQLSAEEANDLYNEAKKTYDYALQGIEIGNGIINTDTEKGNVQEL